MKAVNQRTVMRRINRLLAHDNKVVRKCRHDSPHNAVLGDHFIVCLVSGALTTKVDLDMLAIDLDVLRLDEYLCWEEEEGKVVTV